MYEISVDVGGTFADFVVRDQQGRTYSAKVSSDPENPLEPIMKGLSNLAQRFDLSLQEFLGQTDKFIHGTTVGINALLQGQGVKTALITTEGFRDSLELRRSRLAEQWDFRVALPPVLVPRHLRLGLKERIDYRGVVIKPVDRSQIIELAEILRQEGVVSVAVCLLFSCRNSDHEEEFKEQLKLLLPDIFISLSSELSSQMGEYERTSTTVLNARLSPLLSDYLQELKIHLLDQGLKVPLSVALNNGGLTDLSQASKRAVHTLFSGPAGGVKGGWALAQELKLSELVLADMGGTSFDVSLIRDGMMEVSTQSEVAGYPVQLPMIDIHTVGAGGGSIAWLDKGGMLRVGPHSAGADPGPACYGLGGEEPTITDAALIMGLVDSSNFLGGRMILDEKHAYAAIETKVARPLGLSVLEAAYAIYQIALSLMVDAVYLMTVKKGHDPRLFVLAAVGGALPMFATALAAGVGIKQVIIPELAPVFCAQGLHYARFQTEGMHSFFEMLEDVPSLSWSNVVHELQYQADQELSRLEVSIDQRDYIWSADLKYPDQHHEINITALGDIVDSSVCKLVAKKFHETHHSLYGYSQPEKGIELVNLRLLAQEMEESFQKRLDLRERGKGTCESGEWAYRKIATPKSNETRPVYLRGAFREMVIYHWEELEVGMSLRGPALIKKEFTTILLEENCQAELDAGRNLRIFIGKEGD